MYSIIKTFVDTQSGAQYLFTKSDFYMLESWILWTAISHDHTGDTTQGNSNKIPASSVIIHNDFTHGGIDNRPVGYINADLTTNPNILLSDHIANATIHSAPDENEDVLAAGQLVARGWTEPVYVRVAVSLPVFDMFGYTREGAIMMPFPIHNMSPMTAYAGNYNNSVDPETSYVWNSPIKRQWAESGGGYLSSKGQFTSFDLQTTQGEGFTNPEGSEIFINKTTYPINSPHLKSLKFPYPSDAKDRSNSCFLSDQQQFLYLLPPFLRSKMNINNDFDKVVGSSFSKNNISVFFHEPLFIDSRRTKLLDQVKRSGITVDEILNFRDLIGIFMRDTDKPDFFNIDTDHTCWLTKYRPIMTSSPDSNTGIDVSLFYNDFTQEINQFVSQINYELEGMETNSDVYFDFPFKTVSMNIKVFPRIIDDDELNTEQGSYDSARNEIVQKGFPRCFTKTDFYNMLCEAGGHNIDISRPNETFDLSIYLSGLMEYKQWYNDTVAGMVDDLTSTVRVADDSQYKQLKISYFDKLNVPYGFSNGVRQLLILKDPNRPRENVIIKRNPFSNYRLSAYIILEGYVSVPYEAYVSSFGVDTLFQKLEMVHTTTLDGATPEGWRSGTTAPVNLVNPFPGAGPKEGSDPVIVGPGTPVLPGTGTIIPPDTGGSTDNPPPENPDDSTGGDGDGGTDGGGGVIDPNDGTDGGTDPGGGVDGGTDSGGTTSGGTTSGDTNGGTSDGGTSGGGTAGPGTPSGGNSAV